MSISTKSHSNGQYKKTTQSVGVILAVLLIANNKIEVIGGTRNGTIIMPAATINNVAASPHSALLPNNNWANRIHSISNLDAQTDTTKTAKNAKGVDFLATHFGVPREVAQKHLAKLEAEEGGMQSAEEADSGAVNYPQQGTAARRIRLFGVRHLEINKPPWSPNAKKKKSKGKNKRPRFFSLLK